MGIYRDYIGDNGEENGSYHSIEANNRCKVVGLQRDTGLHQELVHDFPKWALESCNVYGLCTDLYRSTRLSVGGKMAGEPPFDNFHVARLRAAGPWAPDPPKKQNYVVWM